MLGAFIVVIGIVWLLSRLGVITTDIANIIWPAVVIALGLAMMFRMSRRKMLWSLREESKKSKK